MPFIVSGISLPFTAPPEVAVEQALASVKGYAVSRCYLVKKSVDARRKQDIRFVYSVGLELEQDETAVAEKLARPNVSFKPRKPLEAVRGQESLRFPPVIVGFGPAGIFAGLFLAKHGLRPLILERGSDVDTRAAQVEGFWSTGALHRDSNVQFGEGGAGAFSDGKLTTRIGDPRCAYVLEQLAAHGAPQEVLYLAKPHVGTDKLRGIVKSLREEIIALGGQVHFDTAMTGLRSNGERITEVRTSRGDLPADVAVLAGGHSARDVFELLANQGIPIEAKPFSVGVRIEHLQRDIDLGLYGEQAGHPLLPKGEYQLSHRSGGRGVYTFCMCPGGVVVPAASEEGMVVTNGMSEYARDRANANAGLVVSVDAADYGPRPLDGVEFQRRLETAAFLAGGGAYKAPAQSVGRFLEGKAGYDIGRVEPTYARGVAAGQLGDLLPGSVTDMLREGLVRFESKLRGFGPTDAMLTGIESRTSSPVRIPRGEDMQSPGLRGLYPCGEGAGYAGGIVSAAVDGLRVAQAILARYGDLEG